MKNDDKKIMSEEQLMAAGNRITGRLAKRRKELGYSQEELSQITGVARRTIIRYEQGNYWISLKHYVSLCEALGLLY